MSEPILHHYRGSPYAEKIRLLLGYKGISWGSLEIPAIPPREILGEVLGVFRRTPVLQFGADFFCDTRLIARVIDALSPDRPLDHGYNRALSDAICGWIEPRAFVMTGPIRFQSASDVHGVFGGSVDAASFQSDRVPFMMPAVDARRFPAMRASAEDHLRAYLALVNDALSDALFIGGSAPTFADFSVYHLIWWLRLPPAHDHLIEASSRLPPWADRMAAIGHGRYVELSIDDAARAIEGEASGGPWKSPWMSRADPRLGSKVTVMADDYGRDAILGTLVDSSDRHITVEYDVMRFGTVRAHFPRLGYEVIAA